MWRKILLSVSLGLNIILFCAFVWSEHGIIAFREMKAQYSDIQQRTKELDQKAFLLTNEIQLLKEDSNYLEKIIRNRLNFVRNNEILYIFPSKKNAYSTGAVENETEN